MLLYEAFRKVLLVAYSQIPTNKLMDTFRKSNITKSYFLSSIGVGFRYSTSKIKEHK